MCVRRAVLTLESVRNNDNCSAKELIMCVRTSRLIFLYHLCASLWLYYRLQGLPVVRDRRAIGEKQQKQEKGCETAAGTKHSCSRVRERPHVRTSTSAGASARLPEAAGIVERTRDPGCLGGGR